MPSGFKRQPTIKETVNEKWCKVMVKVLGMEILKGIGVAHKA